MLTGWLWGCDLLENSYLCGSNNNLTYARYLQLISCDLLENSYLCGSNNNCITLFTASVPVVICLKIPTFVVATTTQPGVAQGNLRL